MLYGPSLYHSQSLIWCSGCFPAHDRFAHNNYTLQLIWLCRKRGPSRHNAYDLSKRHWSERWRPSEPWTWPRRCSLVPGTWLRRCSPAAPEEHVRAAPLLARRRRRRSSRVAPLGLLTMWYSNTCVNDELIRLNKFVSRITENFCNLFFYYYPNTPYDTTYDIRCDTS